ncbi:hypothetical protein [Lactobacillus johnsonii]|uniref:hypothetical protein n=1 Tax=Lactobacillus johnsonii TaxID=33959 RepID=UPI001E638B25|nr:hypothetical protein [Lactobacillus johnsonii]
MVDMNKELLHAGYQLHLVFDEMVQEIRKDSDNWIMIIEKNIDQISSLISAYHKIAEYSKKWTTCTLKICFR